MGEKVRSERRKRELSKVSENVSDLWLKITYSKGLSWRPMILLRKVFFSIGSLNYLKLKENFNVPTKRKVYHVSKIVSLV